MHISWKLVATSLVLSALCWLVLGSMMAVVWKYYFAVLEGVLNTLNS